MLYGQEFLGAAKYQKFAIKQLPEGRCGKTFSKEFGPTQKILRAWAAQGTHPIVATQGLWRGGEHDYSGEKILTEGLKELEKFCKIASDFPSQIFQFSIFCEHKLKTSYLEKVFTEQWKIVKNLPNIVLVNTPMQGGDLLKLNAFGIPADRLLNEIHGNWNPNFTGFTSYMWACDGLPAQDSDIQKFKDRHENALVIWLWMQQYNCKKKATDTTPIPKRKVKPVKKQVISLEALIPLKGKTKFQSNSIAKSHADQHHDKPVGREQKPVYIVAEEAMHLNLIAANGKKVAKAKYAGKYVDGRSMFRAEKWGYKIADKAVKLSGSSLVTVIAVKKNNKRVNLGTINPAFRENAWRLTHKDKLKAVRTTEEFFDDEAPINPDWV